MKHVLITGSSTGIGYDAARLLTERGYHVFGSVRREADGARVRAALGEQFTPLLFDVTDGEAITAAAAQVAERVGNQGLAGLVNNAGIAVAGPLLHLPLERFIHQFDVNLFGVVRVTQAFLPLLGARPNCPHPPGRILNISSVSGQIAYPFFAPYAGTKHALEALSHSLRRELLPFGVDVIVIAPGSIATPIWDKHTEAEFAPYQDTAYAPLLAKVHRVVIGQGKNGLPVARVSRTILTALEHPRPRAHYTIVRHPISDWLAPRWLPPRWLDRIVGRVFGLRKTG